MVSLALVAANDDEREVTKPVQRGDRFRLNWTVSNRAKARYLKSMTLFRLPTSHQHPRCRDWLPCMNIPITMDGIHLECSLYIRVIRIQKYLAIWQTHLVFVLDQGGSHPVGSITRSKVSQY
jgi:hypothetical protein